MMVFFDEFEFNSETLELKRDGSPVRFDPLLLRMLGVLSARPGQLVTKQDLVRSVWGGGIVTDNAVTVAIARLRRLLGHEREKREFIVTVHGRGYRFVRHVSSRSPEAALKGAAEESSQHPLFVGRERVLKHLREALEEARDGRGSACMLLGDSGMGKTRAIEIIAQEATAAGVPVAWGYCREVGDTPPLWPFAQLIRELLTKVPLDPSDAHFRRLVPQLKRVLPELVEPTALQRDDGDPRSSQVARYKIFDATARVLAMAAQKSPCVLVLDDLHRADPASLELLRYLIDELAITRIALYGTVRTSEPLHPHLEHVLGHRNVARITLEPLAESDVASYVRGVLREPYPALAQAVFRKSEGNPFFMTELLRHVRERDNVDPESLEVPDAARELVRQRAARLDDAARGVLSNAAVIGRRFDLPVLHALIGGSLNDLMSTLDEALARGVLSADPNSTTAFAFSHELLRSALYDALPRRERRGLHLAVAQALEQRAAAGDSVPSGDLAYHFRAALPVSDPRKVVHYCRAAALEATRVHSYTDGARYMNYARDALDLMEQPSPRMRMTLLLQQAMFIQAQSWVDAQRLLREVIGVARTLRAGPHMVMAVLLLDPNHGVPASPDTATLLQEALGLLGEDEAGWRAAAIARLATLPPLAWSAEASAVELERAKQLAEQSGEPMGLYITRLSELYLEFGPEQRRQAEQTLEEVQRLGRLMTMTIQPLLRESYRALMALQDGDQEAMYAALARGEAACQQLDTDRIWYFERFAAVARINNGHVSDGTAQLEALHQRVRGSSNRSTELLYAYDECVIMGRPTKLPKHVLRDVFAFRPEDPPAIWAMKVRGLTAAGLHDEARTVLEVIPPSKLADLPHDREYLGTLGALARAATVLRARDYITALQPLLARYPTRFAVNSTFFSEGRISDLLESLEHTKAHWGLAN